MDFSPLNSGGGGLQASLPGFVLEASLFLSMLTYSPNMGMYGRTVCIRVAHLPSMIFRHMC